MKRRTSDKVGRSAGRLLWHAQRDNLYCVVKRHGKLDLNVTDDVEAICASALNQRERRK